MGENRKLGAREEQEIWNRTELLERAWNGRCRIVGEGCWHGQGIMGETKKPEKAAILEAVGILKKGERRARQKNVG